MPRFELDGAIWEITRSGTSLEITTTPITTSRKKVPPVKPTIRKFVSEDAATKVMATLIEEHERAGYHRQADAPFVEPEVETVETVTEYPRSVELEQAIATDPYDPGAYLVYADWLQAHGDPRGELIVLQVTAAAKKQEVGAEIMALMKRHKASLLGPLAGRTVPKYDQPPLIWRCGFIHKVELEREIKGKPITPTLEAVLGHASGSLVAELVLRSDDLGDLSAALDVLARRAPASLRSLDVVSRTEICDLTRTLAALPHLRRLSVKIRSRSRVATGMSRTAARSIVVGVPATLSRLELRCGTGGVEQGDLLPLFQRTDLTNLTHLRIRDARFADALVEAIVAAPFAHQLVVLDLGMSEISDATARLLVEHAGRLAALAELWVSRDRLSKIAFGLLEGVARLVDLPREPVDATLEEINRARYGSSWE